MSWHYELQNLFFEGKKHSLGSITDEEKRTFIQYGDVWNTILWLIKYIQTTMFKMSYVSYGNIGNIVPQTYSSWDATNPYIYYEASPPTGEGYIGGSRVGGTEIRNTLGLWGTGAYLIPSSYLFHGQNTSKSFISRSFNTAIISSLSLEKPV